MISIFIFGIANASYRPSLWCKFFLDRPNLYSLSTQTGDAYCNAWKPLRVLLRLLAASQGVIGADVVIIQPMNHSGPYARWVMLLANILKRKIIVDFYISHYETKVIDREIFSKGSTIAKKIRDRDINAITKASITLFLNKSEHNYYTSILRQEISQSRVAILPLVMPDRRCAEKPWLMRKTHDPIIAWWGREGNPLHGFDCIAEAVLALCSIDFPAKFAFFPAGGEHWEVFKVKHHKLFTHPKIFITNEYNFSNGRLEEYVFKHVDIALGTFGTTKKAETVITNKVLEAASYAIPCITQHSSGLAEYFCDTKNIIFCKPEPGDLARSITEAVKHRDDLVSIGNEAQKIIREHFSPENFSSTLETIIKGKLIDNESERKK